MSYARIMRIFLIAPSDEYSSDGVGASGRNRTNDTRIFSPLLYRLSYRGIRDTIASLGDPERARTVDLQRDRLAF